MDQQTQAGLESLALARSFQAAPPTNEKKKSVIGSFKSPASVGALVQLEQ